MVRNLILRYTKEGENILDPMIGGGTTAIEAKLLGRNLLCYDINPKAIAFTESFLDFEDVGLDMINKSLEEKHLEKKEMVKDKDSQ